MKTWLLELIGDIQHIWREFRREVANANPRNVNDEDYEPEHSVNWNNVPDLDPRKPVNNLDNYYSRELRGTDKSGTNYQHRHL